MATEKKHHAALDDLERELGLSLDDPESNINSTWTTVEGKAGIGAASSQAGSKTKKNGLIPPNWIYGMFTGSLPPEQARQLIDWATLENERYAGIVYCMLYSMHDA